MREALSIAEATRRYGPPAVELGPYEADPDAPPIYSGRLTGEGTITLHPVPQMRRRRRLRWRDPATGEKLGAWTWVR